MDKKPFSLEEYGKKESFRKFYDRTDRSSIALVYDGITVYTWVRFYGLSISL